MSWFFLVALILFIIRPKSLDLAIWLYIRVGEACFPIEKPNVVNKTTSNTYHVLALITSTFHEKIFISPIIYFFHEKVKILLVVANKKKFFCLLEFEYHSMEKLHCTIKLLFFLFIYTYVQLIFMCELLHILIWRKICN